MMASSPAASVFVVAVFRAICKSKSSSLQVASVSLASPESVPESRVRVSDRVGVLRRRGHLFRFGHAVIVRFALHGLPAF